MRALCLPWTEYNMPKLELCSRERCGRPIVCKTTYTLAHVVSYPYRGLRMGMQPNSDSGDDRALESIQYVMTVFDTTLPIYSEYGSYHAGTREETDIFKMAAAKMKTIIITIYIYILEGHVIAFVAEFLRSFVRGGRINPVRFGQLLR